MPSIEILYDSEAHRSLLLNPDRPVELRPSRSRVRRFAFARVGLAVVAISGFGLVPANSLAGGSPEPEPIVTAYCEITTTLADGTPSGVLADGAVCVLPPRTTGEMPNATTPPPPPPPPPPLSKPAPVAEQPADKPAPVSEQPVVAAPAPPAPPVAQAPAVQDVPPAADATPAVDPRKPAEGQPLAATGPAAQKPVATSSKGKPANKRRNAKRRDRTPSRERRVSPRKAQKTAGASTDAATYAALPASWTSLAPLSIPSFGVDGFPIPPFLLPLYQAAAAQYGVPWEVLASINEIESDFGRNAGVSSAGAMGWMQFIRSSWVRWGTDSDADGRRDPRNPVDAIFAAARYLRDAGAHTDLPKAIFAYNRADWYVNRVVERAREFAGLDKMLVAALSERALREDFSLFRARGNPFAGHGAVEPSAGQALLLTKRQLIRTVLTSDEIDVYPAGRQDIAKGHVDRRVLATLVFLARSGLDPTVSSLISGHSLRTKSGNISAHSYGHAVDISAINGVSIAGNQGAESITSGALDKLVQLQGYLRPNQIISLMTVDGQDNTLSMGDHADHIHIGFARVPRVAADARPADIVDLVAAFRARNVKSPAAKNLTRRASRR